MPIAATTQSVAAVVSPRTERPCRMIAPAPRKPIPVTIWEAIRVGSARTTAPPGVAATTIRSSASSQESDGMSASSSIERGLLRRADLGDPAGAEIQQLVQRVPIERGELGGRSHLAEPP